MRYWPNRRTLCARMVRNRTRYSYGCQGHRGGFPLGAVLAKTSASSGMTAGTHGSTYGGNPLACSVGIKVLEIVNTPEFLNSVTEKSGLITQGLLGLIDKYPDIFEEIRGTGLMLGLNAMPKFRFCTRRL